MSESNTGDVFSSLLSNPAMLSSIAKLLSGVQSTAQSAPEQPEGAESGAGEANAGAPDMSGIISAALSNPQIIAALPKLLETLSSAMPKAQSAGGTESGAQGDSTQASASGMENLGKLLPAFSGGGEYKKPPKVTDRRSALLLALKPYMSHDKAEMIDTIVRIIEIMTLIK